MTPAARRAAVIEILATLEEDSRPADRVVASYMRQRRYIGSKDRNEISEQVFGILRRRYRLDWWLEQSGVGIEDWARARVIADLCLVENVSSEFLLSLFDGERHHAEPLSESEVLLKNALVGKFLDQGDMPPGVQGECPEWIAGELKAHFGDDFLPAMKAMGTEAPFDLRVNTLHRDRETLRDQLKKEGMSVRDTPLSPLGLRANRRIPIDGLKAFKAGHFEVQDEGSQLAALLVDVKPGMQVADFCAGAGGKSLAIAAGMNNKGRVLAIDVSESRLKRAGVRARRAGIHNIERRHIEHERDKKLKRLKGKFDRVLVDAPCGGSGTWRRNPDARWRYEASDIEELTAQQDAILSSAARFVKPGGRLVYVTCSLLPQENEGRIEHFLSENEDFETVPVHEVWRAVLGDDVPESIDGKDHLRLYPHVHGTDGFFAAILKRAESE